MDVDGAEPLLISPREQEFVLLPKAVAALYALVASSVKGDTEALGVGVEWKRFLVHLTPGAV